MKTMNKFALDSHQFNVYIVTETSSNYYQHFAESKEVHIGFYKDSQGEYCPYQEFLKLPIAKQISIGLKV